MHGAGAACVAVDVEAGWHTAAAVLAYLTEASDFPAPYFAAAVPGVGQMIASHGPRLSSPAQHLQHSPDYHQATSCLFLLWLPTWTAADHLRLHDAYSACLCLRCFCAFCARVTDLAAAGPHFWVRHAYYQHEDNLLTLHHR